MAQPRSARNGAEQRSQWPHTADRRVPDRHVPDRRLPDPRLPDRHLPSQRFPAQHRSDPRRVGPPPADPRPAGRGPASPHPADRDPASRYLSDLDLDDRRFDGPRPGGRRFADWNADDRPSTRRYSDDRDNERDDDRDNERDDDRDNDRDHDRDHDRDIAGRRFPEGRFSERNLSERRRPERRRLGAHARPDFSAAQLRRTGVATAVLSTIGLAMINTTGIARSDTTQDPEIRPTGTVLGSTTTFAAAGVATADNTTTDPALVEDQQRFDDHVYVVDEVTAQEATTLINQRNAEIAEALERIEAARWVRPIEAPVTQRFSTARNHMGVDFGGAYGIPVYAAHRGEVIFAGWMTGFGNLVQVRHENNVVTYYGHLSRIDVRVGQQVATGEQIGKQGNTGRSTGPHLHFEVHLNGPSGTEVDPLAWLEGHGVTY